MRKSQRPLMFCAAAALTVFAAPAMAVDGVILIDQNKALAGGVTPGDAAGFPVTISAPGSYRLAGNLIVPNGDTSAIVIAASHVTLDLNGFAILGPVDCSGGLDPCAHLGAGAGSAITTSGVQFNITVRNGTVQGMGNAGISLQGDSHLVEYMHVRSNGNGGIRIIESSDHGGSIVQHNTVQRNGTLSGATGGAGGIRLYRGSVEHNVVDVNFDGVIVADVGTVSHNVITRNVDAGLIMTAGNYIANVFNGNSLDIAPPGGVNQGQNLCGNSPCSGAAF